jgi:hypothetical protein
MAVDGRGGIDYRLLRVLVDNLDFSDKADCGLCGKECCLFFSVSMCEEHAFKGDNDSDEESSGDQNVWKDDTEASSPNA